MCTLLGVNKETFWGQDAGDIISARHSAAILQAAEDELPIQVHFKRTWSEVKSGRVRKS